MREPWGDRYTGGPRGWAALFVGVSAWLAWTLVIVATGRGMPWQALVWWVAVAAFPAAVIVIPLAYAGLKRCYDRPRPEPGENVTRSEPRRERPDSNRIGGRRMYQVGPNTIRIVDDLPEGVSTAVMEEWVKAVWREDASWNVASGRERGLDDETVKRVKVWLEERGLIDIAANGQWDWTDRGERLCRALERGYDLGWLLDNPPTHEDA